MAQIDAATLLKALPLGVDQHSILAVTDVRGTILSVNDLFCRISGYARSELVGQNHRLLKSGIHPEEFYRQMWSTITSGNVWKGEICNRAKDGRLYWVETTIFPVVGTDGKPEGYLSLRTDITRLKETESALRELASGLESKISERTRDLDKANQYLKTEIEASQMSSRMFQEKEKHYRILLSSVTDYLYTVQVENGRAVCTLHYAGCEKITGYTSHEFERDPDLWIRMVPEEDQPSVTEQARLALMGREVAAVEHRILSKSGQLRWIRNTIVHRHPQHGSSFYYDGLITDITDRKSAEEAVRKLNEELELRVVERTEELASARDQLQLLFDNVPIGISWVEFAESNIYHLNRNFCRIVGLDPKTAEKFENILARTHPEDRARQLELHQQLQSGERDRYSLEKRYIHPDGRIVWANLTVVTLRSNGGQIIQQFAIVEDITHRREMEQAIRDSEKRFRAYVENASEILYSLSPEGEFLYVSPSWEAKLGHSPREVVGQHFGEYVHPDDISICHEFLNEVRQTGRAHRSVEYRVRHKNGTYRWHASTGSIIRNQDGSPQYFLGVGRDITLRRETEQELRVALRRREELERIIERSPSVVVLWRNESNWPVEFISTNVRQFGYEAEDLISGKLLYANLIDERDRNRIIAEVEEFGRQGKTEYSQQYRLIAANGRRVWVEDHTFVRHSSEGVVTHHEAILTDITNRMEAEQREREQKEREIRMARDVQRHLLPSLYPIIDGAEVASLYTPSMLVGGDYYDVFPLGRDRWGLAVADVSGKGTPAALMMAACRSALRLIAPREVSASEVLHQVNMMIAPDMPEDMFIAMTYGVWDTRKGTFTFARAGHEPTLFMRRDGSLESHSPHGMALGLERGDSFRQYMQEASVVLSPGDILILFTDGITEALDETETEFGVERLVEVIRRDRSCLSLRQITEQVELSLRAYAAPHKQSDDRTLLLLRRKGELV